MKRIINLLLLSVLIVSPAYAHLYKTYVWEATDKNVSGPQYIVELSDHHFANKKQNQVNNAQRKSVVEQAKALDARVIVEDMFVPGQEDFAKNPLNYNPNADQRKYYSEKACNNIPDKYCSIFGMQLQCQYADVPVVNIECRQPRISSMEKGSKIPAKIAVQATHNAIAQAKKYNDGAEYNNVYKQMINDLELETLPACEPLLQQLCDADYSIQEMLPTMKYDNKVDTEFNFDPNMSTETKKNDAVILFDRALVDINILHEIAQTKNQPVAMVCAGGGHIERINELLPELGYKKVLEFPQRHHSPHIEPNALDMTKVAPRIKEAIKNLHNIDSKPTTIAQAIDEQKVEFNSNKLTNELLLLFAAILLIAGIIYMRKRYKR